MQDETQTLVEAVGGHTGGTAGEVELVAIQTGSFLQEMLHEKASITGALAKKLLPMPKPKNCEYQSSPANAQKSTLFVKVELGTERQSLPVLFLMF